MVKEPLSSLSQIPIEKYLNKKEAIKKGANPVTKRHMDKLLSNCQQSYFIQYF